jgi:hypothetical protein
MPDDLTLTSNAPLGPTARQRWLEVALILLVFYLNSGWAVPDNNEAHYLGKARHYWDPSYCAGDAFFESAHTHQVFYAVFGWWTLFLPLPTVAWIGRLLTWTLLALGWQRLSWRVAPRPWWAVFSAALMIALQERCQVAGEWLVGGFEAKGIAYALVFFGLDAAFAGRWRTVWLWLGAASAWHVLVGGWSVVAMLFAWWWERRRGAAPSLAEMIVPLLAGFAISLPGLLPALALSQGADPIVLGDANRIYVFERLPHHLNPWKFTPRGVSILLLLLAGAGFLSRTTPATAATRISWRFALGSAGLSLVGWSIAIGASSWPNVAAAMLKYYWFRLADVAIPLAASLLAVSYLYNALRAKPAWAKAWLTVATLFAAFHLTEFGIQTQTRFTPRADRPGKVDNPAAWREVCAWIRENTPAGAKFLTPRQNQTFKWHAERAEVVTWKDVPQDAEAIVKWRRRLDEVYDKPEFGQQEAIYARDWSDLVSLNKSIGADYVVVEGPEQFILTPFEHRGGPKPVYTNWAYWVYKFPNGNSADGSSPASK